MGDDGEKEEYEMGDWSFVVTRGRIMKSMCSCGNGVTCQPCLYQQQLPHLPDMLFADNRLAITNRATQATLRFDPISALKTVREEAEPTIKVKGSGLWMMARRDCPYVNNTTSKPYDWTFTPHYAADHNRFHSIERTEERIDVELLKVREPIQFYQELTMYEDELADNGASQLTVKLRCMPSGYFVLLRFYLRVDFVVALIKDVRFHWRTDRPDYVLREYQTRRKEWKDMNEAQLADVLDPAQLWSTLTPIHDQADKMLLR